MRRLVVIVIYNYAVFIFAEHVAIVSWIFGGYMFGLVSCALRFVLCHSSGGRMLRIVRGFVRRSAADARAAEALVQPSRLFAIAALVSVTSRDVTKAR